MSPLDKSAGPDPREPSLWISRRLWSLWDMLNLAIGSFYWLLQNLNAQIQIAKFYSNGREMSEEQFISFHAEVKGLLAPLRNLLTELGLTESGKCINRFFHKLDRAPNIDDIRHEMESLLALIESEGGERWIYNIMRPKGDQYQQEVDAWAPVLASFPSLDQEISDAIHCYLLDRDTACVFHLMRVAEIGLRALAKERRIKIANKPLEWANWQDIINEIKNKTDAIGKRWHAGPVKDAALEFYRGALGQFEGFKDVYRNNVMHVRKRYDDRESAAVLFHVRLFMVRLSGRLDENAKPIRWTSGLVAAPSLGKVIALQSARKGQSS